MRYGVTTTSYGGMSLYHARLMRELIKDGVPIVAIQGCPYPEMARAEQVRRALASDIDVLVFLDSHIDVDYTAVKKIATKCFETGDIVLRKGMFWEEALEFAAVPRSILEAIVADEARLVDTTWAGKSVPAVPIASPWKRDGSSLTSGVYLTDSEAFIARAINVVGARIDQISLPAYSNRRPIVYDEVNTTAPITDEPGSHFALCIPSFGALDPDQVTTVRELERVGMTVLRVHDCPWIDHARGSLAERATELGKGVFFLDHDIQFLANDVLRLCEQALSREAVVAAAYCMRKSGANLIGAFDLPPGPLEFFKSGSTEPAFYCGLGFAAIPRTVFTRMGLPLLWSHPLQRKIRPYFALDCSTGFYAGEDVSFCNRVHDLAITHREDEKWEMTHSGRQPRVFIDTRVRIAHRGVYDYGIEDVGLVVPRIEVLKTVMTKSKQEARDMLTSVLDLPVETRLDQLPFDEEFHIDG